MKNQTIAAIATGDAVGSISVIRISGDDAIAVAQRVFKSNSGVLLKDMKGYTAKLGKAYRNKKIIDEVIVLVFKAPYSYTGEDMVEFFCHGGIFVTRQILESLLLSGAAPPGPGEFTKRAYLNGKMSLIKAESVMNIISAQGTQSLNAALVASEGKTYKKIQLIKEDLTVLAAQFAASCDEEDVPEINQNDIKSTLEVNKNKLLDLISNYEKGKIIREGLRTAIIGSPNVGKSTLMNLLTKSERSIVTDIAGTTRDTVEEIVQLSEITLRLIDTAGIRETSDPIEKIGVERAEKERKNADLILTVFDASRDLTKEDIKILNNTESNLNIAIINKIDLPYKVDKTRIISKIPFYIEISLNEGTNAKGLEEKILEATNISGIGPNQEFLITQRQLCAARSVLSEVESALDNLKTTTLDVVFIHIEEAINKICELTGEKITDAISEEVFSRFCVGK
ncbi:MAG: tRNA uridine-5-carboxymethylaminomethyl(34) synthesis GTPase MnmE [Oscillospiraceae bacterium]|nr:tRNA uridine-5-carboxymethylaminomethyl(34) synthesis GTPase MnmE [Oscillospiraceae bacterium]